MRLTSLPSGSIPCREILDFLGAYLEGELEVVERVDFERHLGRCPSCRAYLDSYRATLELERGAYREADPSLAAMPEELVAAILAVRS